MEPLLVPALETGRLELAPLSKLDGPDMFSLWASPQVCEHDRQLIGALPT